MNAAQADWRRARPWIEAALAHADGAFDIDDVEAAIAEGQMAFLATPNSALVFEFLTLPKLKALNILLAGGALAEIKDLDPVLVEIARGHGCRRIYVSGRRGWVRALADLGYGDLSAIVSKEV